MKAARIVGRSWRAFAPAAAMLPVACANRDLLGDPKRVRAAVQGEEMMLVPTMSWSGPDEKD